MKTLFHMATDAEGHPKDAVFVDGNGYKYTVPYNDPTEIESNWMASKIIEHCHYYGIVEVHTNKTKTGITYDMEDARERAIECLRISEKACITQYVTNQLEDRVRHNFPPLPPVGRALECVIKHQYNLLKAGIRCVGWEPPYEMEDPGLGHTVGVDPNQVMQMFTQMQAQFIAMQQQINELLIGKVSGSGGSGGGGKSSKKKGAENESASESEPASVPQESVSL